MDDGKRALWTKLVADFELSGLSQRAFAEQKQIGLSNLRYWMYKLRNESRPLAGDEQLVPERAPEHAERRAPEKAARMLPVRVVASPAPKAAEGAGGGRGRGPPRAGAPLPRQISSRWGEQGWGGPRRRPVRSRRQSGREGLNASDAHRRSRRRARGLAGRRVTRALSVADRRASSPTNLLPRPQELRAAEASPTRPRPRSTGGAARQPAVGCARTPLRWGSVPHREPAARPCRRRDACGPRGSRPRYSLSRRRRCRSSRTMAWSSSSRRTVPTKRSATPFCQGLW